jgi:hypothetical protein
VSTTYRPSTPPSDFTLPQRQWLERELQAIKRAWEAEKPSERLQELHAEPSKLFEGLIVLADGTDWDPGSGVGVYVYIGGAWDFLGAAEVVRHDRRRVEHRFRDSPLHCQRATEAADEDSDLVERCLES